MEKPYLSISQVNTYIKNIFEAEIMLQNISVYGEISSYNISNGIAYFNLKDENNLLQCVLFGASKFDAPNIGDMVLIAGSMSYYAKGGRLSFNAIQIEPYEKGLLYEKFLQLKNKLEAQGYFDTTKKLPIPKRVQTIGVVSSATGAVIQDIIDVSTRRNKAINIVLYPAKVQGVGAEYEIAKGIEFFNNYKSVEVIIVARGGGSMEDLQPFNTEIVADAVYKCSKPLVSAVGHETDFTIIDFVSDLRAPTPSAAAELVVNATIDDFNYIKNMVQNFEKSLKSIERKFYYGINTNVNSITNALQNKFFKTENYIFNTANKFNHIIQTLTTHTEHMLSSLQLTLQKLNPNNLLKQGFTKIESNGKVVSSIKNIEIENNINFKLSDGKVFAKVTKKGE